MVETVRQFSLQFGPHCTSITIGRLQLNSVRLFNGIGDVRIGLQHSVGITADSVRWLGAARPSSSVLVAA